MGCVVNRCGARQGDRFRIDIVVQARVGVQEASALPVALWQEASVCRVAECLRSGVMRPTSPCRWRSILVEIPIRMELVWNPDAVKRHLLPSCLDPVHRALQQLVAQARLGPAAVAPCTQPRPCAV